MSFNQTLRLAGVHVHNPSYVRLGSSSICNRTPIASATHPSLAPSTSIFMKRELPTAPSRHSLTTTSKKQAESESNDDEDPRSAIHPERSEYTRSGTDSSVASQKSSWDVSHNTPESARQASDEESQQAGKGKWGPLEISPANQDVSKSTDESGRGESVVHGPSKRISPRKGRKVNYGGEATTVDSEHASPKPTACGGSPFRGDKGLRTNWENL